MSLANSAIKGIDEVLTTTDTDFILPLLYWELLELESYVTIYSLNRSVHDTWYTLSLRGGRMCVDHMEWLLAISNEGVSMRAAIAGFVRKQLYENSNKVNI